MEFIIKLLQWLIQNQIRPRYTASVLLEIIYFYILQYYSSDFFNESNREKGLSVYRKCFCAHGKVKSNNQISFVNIFT